MKIKISINFFMADSKLLIKMATQLLFRLKTQNIR